MALQQHERGTVPQSTVEMARKVFPKGHPYLTLRDKLGELYRDDQFADLFTSPRGRPAEAPGCLALVLVLEFMEDISDEVAADMVRARIDWKYLLGLEVDDSGFEASVLTEFRRRILAGGQEQVFLDTLLGRAAELGLLRKRGIQRTDATHVLSVSARLNRLELVGETLRAALDSLSVAAPAWVRAHAPLEWYERYGHRFIQGPQPHTPAEREACAAQIAADGAQLFAWVRAADAPTWLRELPAVETLRQVWVQQYLYTDGQWRWRTEEEMPPHTLRIVSPYDTEARYSRKRQTEWSGYKAHITETCDADLPRLITNLETGNAADPDHHMTAVIHAHLAAAERLPREHLLDSGYLDAGEVVSAQTEHQVELVGPLPPDHSWQAQANQGYASACFAIDWEAQQVTCPQGQRSTGWSVQQDDAGETRIKVQFSPGSCGNCPVREQCTRSAVRTLTLHPQAEHETLQQRRQEQTTSTFKTRYRKRAGIEGTLSLGVRTHGLRRARYLGQAKTHLQNLLIAVALNLSRLADWWSEARPRPTRITRFAALAPS